MNAKMVWGVVGWIGMMAVMATNLYAEPQAVNFMTADRIDSLEKYAEWLGEHVAYQPDNGSREWADPQTTVARGYGDCKDYALLSQQALRTLGYEAQIYSVTFSSRDKHAICVFRVNGRYAFFSNDELYMTDASDWQALENYLHIDHGYFSPQVIS
ncbi:MAG: transglutaminase domain-containing protein [Candidatus Omnitrophota bacterium]